MKQDNLNEGKNHKKGWFGSQVSCVWEGIHDIEIFIHRN